MNRPLILLFLSLLMSLTLASRANAQPRTLDTLELTLDMPQDEWPAYVCVLGQTDSRDRDRVKIHQGDDYRITLDDVRRARRLGNRPQPPIDVTYDSVRSALTRPDVVLACGEDNPACRPSVHMPTNLGREAWMTCAANTFNSALASRRVLLLAFTGLQGAYVNIEADSLRGNYMEFIGRSGGALESRMHVAVVGGHYVEGPNVRLWNGRGALAPRPQCPIRTIDMPAVSGYAAPTHHADITITRAVTAPDTTPGGGTLLRCKAPWSSPLLIAVPHRSTSASVELVRQVRRVPDYNVDAVLTAQWPDGPPPASLVWRATQVNFAWRVRHELPMEFTGCPEVNLPDVARCRVVMLAAQQDTALLRDMGHEGSDFCFYRCGGPGGLSSDSNGSTNSGIDFPSNTSWEAHGRGEYAPPPPHNGGSELQQEYVCRQPTGGAIRWRRTPPSTAPGSRRFGAACRLETVATWNDRLLRPLQVFDGYAEPANRSIVVDLRGWVGSDDVPHNCSQEINLADASGATVHVLRPFLSLQRFFPVRLPLAAQGARASWRVLGCRYHDLDTAELDGSRLSIPHPRESIRVHGAGLRFSTGQRFSLAGDTPDASTFELQVEERTWRWARWMLEFPASITLDLARGASPQSDGLSMRMGGGAIISWAVLSRFHLGLGLLGSFGHTLPDHANPFWDAWIVEGSFVARMRYQFSAVANLEFDTALTGSGYFGEYNLAGLGLHLQIGLRLWSL